MAFSKLKAHLRKPAARTYDELWKAVGNIFSGADIAIGYCINWLNYVGMLDNRPRLVEYYALLKQRPAFQKVFMPQD